MQKLLTIYLLLLLANSATGRIEIPISDCEIVELTSVEAKTLGIFPVWIEDDKLDTGTVSFDVTSVIGEGRINYANVSLFSDQHKITEFGVGANTIHSENGSRTRLIEFQLNKTIVTSLIVRFNCNGSLQYVLHLPTKTL